MHISILRFTAFTQRLQFFCIPAGYIALKLIVEENGRNTFKVQMFFDISAVSLPLSSFAPNSISSSFIPFSLSFLLCNKSLE